MFRLVKRILFQDGICGDEVTITESHKLHHLLNVLKIEVGDKLRIFNADNGEWIGDVVEIKNKRYIKIAGLKKIRDAEKKSGICIAFAPIKQERLKFLLEKCTEIGADMFIPVITNRSIVRDMNLHKLASYVESASEQSERITVPRISEMCSLENFLGAYKEDAIMFCNESEESKPISAMPRRAHTVILIGPEGGFTDKERSLLMSRPNVNSVFLTKNILRSETAAIFALSRLIPT